MTTPGVFEPEVPNQPGMELPWRFVGPEMGILVLNAAPQGLDEDVVQTERKPYPCNNISYKKIGSRGYEPTQGCY